VLKSIYLKNYALFDETRIRFPKGLNILTGETGAGKSLLVGALGLITGKRADSSAVFYPEMHCVVEAEFDIPDSLVTKLKQLDAFELDDKTLNIRRLIKPNGKSRAFINDAPASLQVIRQVSSMLLDLHSQNENQDLLNPDRQLELLDEFVDNADILEQYGQVLAEAQKGARELQAFRRQEREAKEQQDFIRFQLEELSQAQVTKGEEVQLTRELNLLQNAESVREALEFAALTLYHDDSSAYNQLTEVSARLGKSGALLENYTEKLKELEEQLREVSYELDGLKDQAESDPARLSDIESRLALYHDLVRKYQVEDGDALVDKQAAIALKVNDFDSLSDRIAALEIQQEAQWSEVAKLALKLEENRLRGKGKLEASINSLLAEVGFKQAELFIEISRLESERGPVTIDDKRIQPTVSGVNKVQYRIRTNPGLPAGPLSQIASGGEVSRVMLAIKAALADKAAFPVLIFDEIDTGISGEIAQRVGRVMQQLAQRFQILSITHLPQIAAKGDAHFLIEKASSDEKTVSGIRRLEENERPEVLATMIHGESPSAYALEHARELMEKN
jgi:DNA repair protein RecN (Recombination protein N)